MTTLAIVANHEKKRLSLTGTVAAGEHVAVTLEDGWAWANAAGAALRLRIVFAGKLIAEFPRRDADPADTWSASGDDATCELNINSVPAAKHLKFGGDCIWVLDDPQLNTLYGVGELEVLPWRREPGGDVPYNLDGYPDLLDEFEEVKDAVSEFDTKKINKSAFISLLGKTLPETATQKEVREMVHDILELLKNAAVCAALAFALPAFGIDADTAWEDVPPQSKVKNVVEQFSPPADFSTNNAALVETIEAKVPEIQVDFSTNNAALVTTIKATAPAPGNYAAVSNAAMNAATRSDLAAATNDIPRIAESQNIPGAADYADRAGEAMSAISADNAEYAHQAGEATFAGSLRGDGDSRTGEAIFAQLDAAISINAAQTVALEGKASTNDVQLTPVYGGNGGEFSDRWTYAGLPSWAKDVVVDYRYGRWYLSFNYQQGAEFDSISGDETYEGIVSGLGPAVFNIVFTCSPIFNLSLSSITVTASRVRNQAVGYVLGSQTNKVLASTSAVASAVTYNELTNTVNAVKELHYDDVLNVTWEMRVVGGEIKFFAVTNANISVLGN